LVQCEVPDLSQMTQAGHYEGSVFFRVFGYQWRPTLLACIWDPGKTKNHWLRASAGCCTGGETLSTFG
jgi:hypothetical protein